MDVPVLYCIFYCSFEISKMSKKIKKWKETKETAEILIDYLKNIAESKEKMYFNVLKMSISKL